MGNRLHIFSNSMFKIRALIKGVQLVIFILFPVLFSDLQSQSLKFKAINPSMLGDASLVNIFLSESGKIWFSSARGLTSFDGSRTTFYNKASDIPVLGNALISTIAEDSRNNFWIGTHHKGINYFESKTGRFTKTYLLLKGDSTEGRIDVQDIFIESDTSIWVATTALGFFIYNPVKKQYRHFNLDHSKPDAWRNVPRNTPQSFARDPADKNKIWIGAYDGIYSCHISGDHLKKEFVIPTGKKEAENKPESFCRIQKIHLPGNDTIWFSTWRKGMGYCDLKTGDSRLFPNNQHETNPLAKGLTIVSFCPKSKYEYYVACRNYLPAVFNTLTRQYHFIFDDELNKTSSSTYSILTGKNNSLWICKGGALYFHTPVHQLFKNIDVSHQAMPPVSPNLMREVLWDEHEKKYYVSLDLSSGVYVLDTLLRITEILPVPLLPGSVPYPEASVWKTLKDGSNRLWSFGNIVSVLPDGSKRFEPAAGIYPHIPILKERLKDEAWRRTKHVAADDEDNILILSGNKIFTIYHRELSYDSLVLESNVKGAELTVPPTLLFDKKRKLLYATGKQAIYQYDTKNRNLRQLIYKPGEKNSLPQQIIASFALDGKGNLWVSFPEHGIRIYEPSGLQMIKELTLENSGIPMNSILRNWENDLMLVGTNIGLFIYNIQNNTFVKLNRENGLNLNQPPGGTVIANDILFLGMRDTIQYMPLHQLSSLKENITPYISGVRISGFDLSSDTLPENLQTLNLNYRQRTISFDFSATEFQFPERIRYAYRLDHVDDNWNFTDNNNRTITYANLFPGKYIFRVKANLEYEEMTGAEKTMLIIITPPFWEKWWFRLLALVMAATLLSIIINYRIRQIRKKAWAQNQLRELEMKALKAQMNPHFIYNAMNSIQALVMARKTEEASLYISKFGRLLRQVLNNSDKTLISLENELETLQLYIELEKLRMNMVLDYRIDMNDEVDLNGEMVPPLVFQPFVENALWHGLSNKDGEKKLSILINEQNGWLETIIEDNGIGRSKADEIKKQDHKADVSRGIDITTRRLIEHNKSTNVKPVEISDLYDKDHQPCGTRVTLRIKQVYQIS